MSLIDIGVVKIADDEDFKKLWDLVEIHKDWKVDYQSGDVTVWSKSQPKSSIRMVKLKTTFTDIPASVLFDVLMDGAYRSVWDAYMVESVDIGYLTPNSDIGYYAMSCLPPLKARDFVLQRSWLITKDRYTTFNHSVNHKDYCQRNYVRAISYLTGYVIKPLKTGCEFFYITMADPKGILPAWAVNKTTQILMPRTVKTLHKACQNYPAWKAKCENKPNFKPWLYPEQMSYLPKVPLSECIPLGVDERGEEDESLVIDVQR